MTLDVTARAVAAKTRLVFNISDDMHDAHDASQIGYKQQPPSPSSPSFMVDAGNADYEDRASTPEEGWHVTLGDGRHMPKRSASRTEGSTTGEAGGSPRSRRGGAGRVEEPVREVGELLSLAPAHAPGNRKPLMLTPAAEVKGKGSGEGGSKEERHLSRAVVRPSSASGKGTTQPPESEGEPGLAYMSTMCTHVPPQQSRPDTPVAHTGSAPRPLSGSPLADAARHAGAGFAEPIPAPETITVAAPVAGFRNRRGLKWDSGGLGGGTGPLDHMQLHGPYHHESSPKRHG